MKAALLPMVQFHAVALLTAIKASDRLAISGSRG
jgi:hypothetical protein